MGNPRRNYSKEYKQEAVRRSQGAGVKISQVARELGIRPELLYRWRSDVQTYGEGQAFPGHGNPQASEVEAENRQLKRELARLQQEHEILKKAVSIFSREKP